VEFQIDHTFQVPGTGLVVSGTLTRGVVQTNDQLWLGPIGAQGEFVQVLIRSIQTKRLPVDVASGEEGCVPYCFAIRAMKGKKEALKRTRIHRGMVLLTGESAVEVSVRASCRAFEAEVMVLHHHSTIKQDYQAVVHMGDVRQTAVIERIALLDSYKPPSPSSSSSTTTEGALVEPEAAAQARERVAALRTGDRARTIFRFLFKPEYVRPGCLFLFREGSTKGVGRVTRRLTMEEAEESAASSKAAVEAARKAQGRAIVAAVNAHKDPQ
jgi:GTPase